MSITLNSTNYVPKVAFNAGKKPLAMLPTVGNDNAFGLEDDKVEKSQKTKASVRNFFANIAYGWINLVELTKGLVKGLLAGFLAGTVVAGFDMLKNGIKLKRAGKITFVQMFNRNKAMSKTGKILAPITAGAFFAGNLILARLKTNQRTANVDHQLYVGHRDR